MKKRMRWLFLVIVAIFLGLNPQQTRAFPAVLGTRVIGEEGVSVGGYQVEDPETPINTDTQTPTFYGYTIPNAEVTLIIRSEPKEYTTLSDATGYWSYTIEELLPVGQHTLSLKVTDQYGITSDEVLAATFVTPEVKGEAITPPPASTNPPIPKNPGLNYFTTTLIVLGSLLMLGAVYFYFVRKPQSV